MSTLDALDLRDGYADLGDVRLHYVEAGKGPLVLLLHGFPEFWYGWHNQIPALAAAGFRVVAPDLRGYNLSDKPDGVGAYDADKLATDVRDLVRERGADRALIAGHDWGAIVAWWVAMRHPDVVERLAILNVPHPRRMMEGLRSPAQLRRSWYIFFFQLPFVPERLLGARGAQGLRQALVRGANPGSFSDADLDRYVEAWERPGAITAMLNWYRAAIRRSPRRTLQRLRPIAAPTVVIWGEQDVALGAELAEPRAEDVPGLEAVVRLPHASHFVQHDDPERVNAVLTAFFRGEPVS
jgi:pimeloyl-ACP methyl ester carboxylesterase